MNSSNLTRSAAINGACIGAALGADFSPALWDETQAAALALTAHEARKGFSWEGAPIDWESACARLANEIRAGAACKWPRFVAALLAPGFRLGDRVELREQVDANRACRNGVVILYRDKHHPAFPRVRWASGWGTSHRAEELRHMTARELSQTPPALAKGDSR